MKIKYQFATETVEIEVDDDWGNLIIDLDRQDYNNDHKETRRHVSYDALEFDANALATEDRVLTAYADNDALHQAIQQLTPNQQHIIRAHYFDDRSFTEIAQELGVSVSSVTRSAERARNTLKKML